MACELSLGRREPCKDSVGGIKSLSFLNYKEYNYLVTGGVVTEWTEEDGLTAPTAFRYTLRGANNSLTQNINTGRDNGSTYIEQVIAAVFKKVTAQSNEEFMLMIYGRPVVIVEDNASKLWACGLEFGCDVTGGSAATGAAMGDLNGYSMTLTGMELTFAPEVDPILFEGFTIVEGV